MPTVRSGAYDYIGYLDFPGYDLTMPVAATWSFPAMEISPCRHTGSVYNDNLVVAGHNYKTEFDVLFRLEAGDTVTFTDVDGNVFTYTVREFASVTPDDSDTVMNSGYALLAVSTLQLGYERARVHRFLRANRRRNSRR